MSVYRQKWPSSYKEGRVLGQKFIERESSEVIRAAALEAMSEIKKLQSQIHEVANESAEQEIAWYEGILIRFD